MVVKSSIVKRAKIEIINSLKAVLIFRVVKRQEVLKYVKTIKEAKPDFSETGIDLLFAPVKMLLRQRYFFLSR